MNEVNTYEKNNKKAIILFHAFSGSPNDVNSLKRALEREGYTVVTPTFSGHGQEDLDILLEYGIDDWLQDGEEAYQQLKKEGFTNISVFGLSLGGVIATDLMLNHQLKTYGVFSSPVISSKDTNVPGSFWKLYQYTMKKNGLNPAEIEQRKDAVIHRLESTLHGIDEHVQKMATDYPKVRLPVFIGQGGKDEMIDANLAYKFRDALKNAEVDFHWYEEAPHVITVGYAGKELQKDLIKFLDEYA